MNEFPRLYKESLPVDQDPDLYTQSELYRIYTRARLVRVLMGCLFDRSLLVAVVILASLYWLI